MTDSMLPIIRQMHDAADDRVRARILLAVPDMVLLKHREVFEAACRRASFELGAQFIAWRRAGWNARRGPDGLILSEKFDEVRIAFARYAAGGEHG